MLYTLIGIYYCVNILFTDHDGITMAAFINLSPEKNIRRENVRHMYIM